ncbi:MAG: hypothetical protein V1837_01275 [Candidatus Woesearchaeota archaeon]
MKNIMLALSVAFLLLVVACSKEPVKTAEQVPQQPVGPRCGDGVCLSETQDSCPEDCGHVDSCLDSDNGAVKETKSTVSGFLNNKSFSFVDNCISQNILREYFCSNVSAQEQNISCEGKAQTIKYCNATALYQDTLTPGCEQGICTVVKQRRILQICGIGCEDARCINPEEPPAETVVASGSDTCNDSDGGFDKSVKGIVSGLFNNSPYRYSDFCKENTLVEYSCHGNAYSKQETACPTDSGTVRYCQGNNVYSMFTHYTCVGGACINATAPKLASVCDKSCSNGNCN